MLNVSLELNDRVPWVPLAELCDAVQYVTLYTEKQGLSGDADISALINLRNAGPWKFGTQVITVTSWPSFTHSRQCS